eukprot:symbB.v1.2.035642.t1/scaffold4852.1/size33892/2
MEALAQPLQSEEDDLNAVNLALALKICILLFSLISNFLQNAGAPEQQLLEASLALALHRLKAIEMTSSTSNSTVLAVLVRRSEGLQCRPRRAGRCMQELEQCSCLSLGFIPTVPESSLEQNFKNGAEINVFHTMTPGDEPQGNARAEREVAMVKERMRTALRAAGAPDHYWPLAFRFGVEQRHRQQLLGFGIRCPSLMPFGCKAIAKRKTWHQRADPFKWPTLSVKLWGPASGMTASSNGYFVEDAEGKFFRTTVVYPHVDEAKFQGDGVPFHAQGSAEEACVDGEWDHRDEDKAGLHPNELEFLIEEVAQLERDFPEQSQTQGGQGLETGEQVVSLQRRSKNSAPDDEDQPGSLPGGEEDVKWILEKASKSTSLQEAINSFDALLEKTADKQFLAIVPHDQPRRRYFEKAPPRIENGQPVVYKMEAKDGNQRGSKTGAPDTGKDGNQRGSKTGAPDTGKDRNQSIEPLPCTSSSAQHCHQSGSVTVNNGRGENGLERELQKIRVEEGMEHLLLKQHQSLMKWIKEVAAEIAEGNASQDEVQCAIQARFEAGQMENYLNIAKGLGFG